MKATELRVFLMEMNEGWVDPMNTVDTFKAGDPESEVRGIAVAWMTYTSDLKKAVELGCNVFITHEPTYYNHLDKDEKIFRFAGVRDKKKWIEDNRLIILRCHDLWDQVPGIGIPDSWAEQLGFSDPIGGEGYFRIYDVSGQTAASLSRHVAEKVMSLGQNSVQLLGPGDVPVTRVAIGTGAITPYLEMVEIYGADLVICTDDGFKYWRDGAFAIDMGIPAIIVNHAVSEIRGIKRLADYLAAQFPDIPVHFLPQGCMFETIVSKQS